MNINDYKITAAKAANTLRGKGVGGVDFAIQAGIGMGQLADKLLPDGVSIPMAEIEQLPLPAAPGQGDRLVYGKIGEAGILIFTGRPFVREGHDALQVALPAAISQALGAKLLILLAACGAVNQHYRVGEIVQINSFISLHRQDALELLESADPTELLLDPRRPYHVKGSQFLGMHVQRQGANVRTGTYVGMQGPRHSTLAELTMIRGFGGDALGAGVIAETVIARLLELPVVCAGVITYDCFRPERLTSEMVERAADKSVLMLSKALTSYIQDEEWQSSLSGTGEESFGV